MEHDIEIVSHPLCPFAQRLVLIALTKNWTPGVEFKVTYLPYATFRQSVKNYSPTGDVPAFILDGVLRSTIAEHVAEFMDGIGAPVLMPAGRVALLKVRGQEVRARQLLDSMRTMFTAQSEETLNAAIEDVFLQLGIIDKEINAEDMPENLQRWGMIAFAPAFSLLNAHKGLREHVNWNSISRLRDVGRNLAEKADVMKSRCPDYATEFGHFFEFTRSVFPKFVAT